MKALIRRYAEYNLWANETLFKTVSGLNEELLHRELPSSFNSIYKTVSHMYDAEKIWWNRIDQQLKTGYGNEEDENIFKALQAYDQLWVSFTADEEEGGFDKAIQYTNSKNETFSQPLTDLLMQMFNHGTYHRGQIVTMLHMVAINPLPNTDFITWSRKIAK